MIKIHKASPADVNRIFDLLIKYSADGTILERTKDEISEYIDNFFIALNDSSFTGVISYFDYGPALKEIRSLAVDKNFNNKGIASELVKFLIKELTAASAPKIFALTYSPDFFKKNGFIEADKNSLPEKIWKDCVKCKNRETCGETPMVYCG
jgi:amino-acid N-acetyltransferase